MGVNDEPPTISLTHEEEWQALLMIEREVGKALRLSFGSIAQEPLPEQMTILLLRLALAESVRMSICKEHAAQKAGDHDSARSEFWPGVAVVGSR